MSGRIIGQIDKSLTRREDVAPFTTVSTAAKFRLPLLIA
jgi:hypothetical protein